MVRNTGIKMVEAGQRKCTKRFGGMTNLDYKERLDLLDAEILELRRLQIDLVTVYKILFGLIDIDFNDYFAFKKKTALPAVVQVITIVLLKAMGVSMHDVIILPSGP